MRTLVAILLTTTAAAAEPARWSVDVHDRVGVYVRSTRIHVSRGAMRVECEVTDTRSRDYRVERSTITRPARGRADGRTPRVCGRGTMGPVCVDVPRDGELEMEVLTDHPACARGRGTVATGD